MAAFKRHGSLDTNAAPVLRKGIIGNSVVSILANSRKIASGFSALGTTGALVFGHVVSHLTADGVGVNTTGAAGAEIGSYAGSWTAASNNQTVAQVVDLCDVSKFTLYSSATDAALGTTTGSNLAGYTQDLVDSTQLDESSAVATTGQYMSHGLDPATPTTRIIVNIYESQVFGV